MATRREFGGEAGWAGVKTMAAAALLMLALPLAAQGQETSGTTAETTAGASAGKPENGQWVSIFNGKDLDGWTPKFKGHDLGENYLNTFRVENGVIRVSYDKYPKFGGEFGHLFYKEELSNYRLRLEYRFVGEQAPGAPAWATRNSGLMLHCQPPDTMRKDQEFPVSLEDQFLGGNGKEPRSTCNLCTPGTNVVMNGELHTQHCTSSDSDTFAGDQWVKAEVEVHGDGTIKHFVNGKQVLEYEKPQYDPKDKDAKALISGENKLIKEGFISLQAESAPVEFRNIELLKLN